MRTSAKMLAKLEPALTSPAWAYCAMWRFALLGPPTWLTAQRAAQSQREPEVRR